MSRGIKGRCSRQHRRTVARKAKIGERFDQPIRYKVPQAVAYFLFNAQKNQKRAQLDVMGHAIARYMHHQNLTGNKGPQIRAAR